MRLKESFNFKCKYDNVGQPTGQFWNKDVLLRDSGFRGMVLGYWVRAAWEECGLGLKAEAVPKGAKS